MVVASQRSPWQRGHVRHVTSTSRFTLTSPLATSRDRGGCGEHPLPVDAAKEAGVRWVLRRRPNGIVSLEKERKERGNFVIYYFSRSLCVGMVMCFNIISLSTLQARSLVAWRINREFLFWLPTGYGYSLAYLKNCETKRESFPLMTLLGLVLVGTIVQLAN